MKEILNFLPDSIESGILVALCFGAWKLYQFIRKLMDGRKREKESFRQEIIIKEASKQKIISRLDTVEADIMRVMRELKEHKLTYNSGFESLSLKIDKITELLINFSSNK